MILSSGIGKYGDKYVSREWDTKPTDNDSDDNNNTEE